MASYNYGELNQRLLDANRRMENSSFRCVQILNETVKMATDTLEELEIQGKKSLNRTEDNLDKMATDLVCSQKNTREVKLMFRSMVNHFTKPKIPSDLSPKKSSVPLSKSSKGASKPTVQAQVQKKSTGNKVVDRNLDQLEFGLKQLEQQAYLIGSLLDESNDQLEHVSKMDHNNIIRTELYPKGNKHIRGSDPLEDKEIR